jgi:hypothetical protein
VCAVGLEEREEKERVGSGEGGCTRCKRQIDFEKHFERREREAERER